MILIKQSPFQYHDGTFYVKLTGPWGAQIAGQILVMSVMVFWMRLTFESVDRIKGIALPGVGEPHLIS